MRFDQHIILVTGATRGIGKACALALVKEGAHVLALGRTQSALEKLDDDAAPLKGKITLIPFDLSAIDQIANLCLSITQRFERIDALLGNAGTFGALTPTAHTNIDEWVRIFTVNVTANLALIKYCDPLLQQSKGRAVFLTSKSAKTLRPFFSSYATSKLALEAMVKIYARENEKTGVKINLFDPKIVRTRMRAETFPGEDPSNLPSPETLTPKILNMLSKDFNENGQIIKA
ncbi:MAG: SDR family NAD(P)-dependent oxidoreductase [Pseudomonadota bacterium]